MKTPDWILEGKEKPKEKKKSGKTFKVRKCAKCNSDAVEVVVGKEKIGEWQCKKCNWTGRDVKEEELSEEEFMKYLDEKGEEVA